MNIGKKIKKLRLERNMSQEKLAKMLGISRESISQYENNKIIPPVNVLEQIAEVFNVPVKYFFEEETEEVGEDNTKFSDSFPSNSMGFMVGNLQNIHESLSLNKNNFKFLFLDFRL